jgi:type IV secretory pathway VirB2 component (pilin)
VAESPRFLHGSLKIVAMADVYEVHTASGQGRRNTMSADFNVDRSPVPNGPPVREKASRLAYTIAAVAGMALWLATSALGGRSEPWDAPIYWSIAYPVALVLAAGLGYLFPRRPWRWALTVMFMQAAVMVLGGASLGLLPLGLVVLGVLSLPAVLFAWLAARLRPWLAA